MLNLLSQLSTGPIATSVDTNGGTDLSYQAISFLTFQAVLEVVIICIAGFTCAKTGLLNTKGQKVISQLNVDLFTPCLVFTKLAPSLSFQKMADIVIIPIFFTVSSAISFGCSRAVARAFRLNDPESDYVTAMAVFGNSNSLPVSLTLSLAYTLPDLLWDDLDDDNSDKVASRGILYLLIFQQLGQVLRWSWGYNKLLKKRSVEELNTYFNSKGQAIQHVTNYQIEHETSPPPPPTESTRLIDDDANQRYTEPPASSASSASSSSSEQNTSLSDQLTSTEDFVGDVPTPPQKSWWAKLTSSSVSHVWHRFTQLPVISQFLAFMNPPLYAMLISVIIASVPSLQDLFFNNDDSFVKNTLTKSINQLGQVSIPLILVVLGSNLCPTQDLPPASRHYTKIVIGSLLSRMILPSIILLPIIAACVKYINVSILDDPIFLIVAFILTISPPAIQLSQITQLNNIYQREMAGVLFWGYVVLTLPTTILIVVTSLEVLKWAL